MNVNRILATVIIAAFAISCTPSDRFVNFSGYAQGGTYNVKANLKGVRVPEKEIQARLDSILLTIDTTLSGYNKSSMLSRFNNGERIVPNTFFKEIYSISRDFWIKSEGALDVAAGPLFDIWGFGFKGRVLPTDEEVAEVMENCGMQRFRQTIEEALEPDGSLVPDSLLVSPGTLPRLNFNCVAQGYAADCLASYLKGLGVEDMLVDLGEIFCCGHNPSGRGWTIGVDKPYDGNVTPGASLQAVHHCSENAQGIVTSGNYRKFQMRDGKKIAHTIDPRTGRPAEHNLLSSTILAPTAAEADATATWTMVVGLEEAKQIVARLGYEAFLVYDVEGEMKTWASEGFKVE